MKKTNELTFTEKKEIAKLLGNWLSMYTQEVVMHVMEKRDEIINNEFTMNLLKELKEREDKERDEFADSISSLLGDFDTFKQFDPHNHVLTHSKSYRDILYDMYITDKHEKKLEKSASKKN